MDLLTCVVQNLNTLGLLNFYDEIEGDKPLRYVLDLKRLRIFNKLPEDGTLVSKHVVVGAQYEVFYDLFHCISFSAFCWEKIWSSEYHML